MDLKRKLKRFFSFRRRSEAGFTLVELIVVIAILAILGGVAVPVYSGYIAKTNLAADQKLLAVVNRAFASACVENGANVYNLVGQPSLAINGERAVTGVDMYNDAFLRYYKDNENSVFKTDYAVIFDGDKGAFILFSDGTEVTLNYNGGKITVSAEDAEKLKESSFITAPELGVDGLLEKVNYVADFATLLNSSTYSNVLGSDDYKRSFLKALGEDPVAVDGMSRGELSAKYRKKLGEMEAQMQLMYPDKTAAWVSDKLEANMMVLYAAQNTNTLALDRDRVTALLNSDTPKSDILKAATGEDISQAALYYGMYTAYAYANEDDELIAKTGNPLDLFNAMTPEETVEFKKYVNSEQGQKDLEAYLTAMQVITDATSDNKAGVEGVLTNNFNDSELIKLFEQVVGE